MNEPPLPIPPFPPAPEDSSFGPIVPMTFGQILDRIFRLMRSHVRPFAAIGMLPIGAMFAVYGLVIAALALSGLLPHPSPHPDTTAIAWTFIPIMILAIPLMILIYGPYYAAASYAALQADRGLNVTAREALRIGFCRTGRYAWLMLLRALIVAGPIAAIALVIFAGTLLLSLSSKGISNTAALFFLIPLGVLLYLGAVGYAVVMSLRLSLAYPACVSESLTASQAIKRSGVLTQGAKGRIFLALLVIYAIGYAIFLIFYLLCLFIFAIGTLAIAGHTHPASLLAFILLGLLVICAIVVMLLWTVLLMAAYSAAFAVFYRDQCLRKDGHLPSPVPAVEPA